MFFREVKISWLSKNDRVIGARRLVKNMCHFSQKHADSFFCFKFPVFFLSCIFFFGVHLVSFFLWWRLVVYLSQLSCQCYVFFAENSVSFLPLFFSFLNKLLLMLIYFVENGVTCVFTSTEYQTQSFEFLLMSFFCKTFPFFLFFKVCLFLVCAFL